MRLEKYNNSVKNSQKSAYLENLGKILKNPNEFHISGNLLEPIQNLASARSVHLEAAL